jgi:hypothetical protein
MAQSLPARKFGYLRSGAIAFVRQSGAEMSAPSPPPGWYPDPSGAPQQRYWDGSKWTEHRTWTPPPKSPAGWYPDPSGAPGQRYWDGRQWTITASPKVRSSPLKTLAIVGAAVFALVGGCAAYVAVIGHNNGGGSSTGSSTSTSPSRASLPIRTSPPAAAIGQEVRDGKFAFTVTGVRTSPAMGTRVAQGVYVLVSMTVRNTGSEPWSFFGINQKLTVRDESSRRSSGSSAAEISKTATTLIPATR